MWLWAKSFWFIFTSFLYAQAPAEHPAFEEKEALENIRGLFRNKNFSQAELQCEKYLKIYPYSLPFYYECGFVYFYSNGSWEKKKKDYGKSIRLWEKALPAFQFNYKNRKDLAILQFYIGLAWHFSRNYDMAISWYREAIKSNDRLSAAWYNLGSAYEAKQNIIEANRAYLKYQETLRKDLDEF